MIYVLLVVLGLCFGSFINALVWRLHEQDIHDKSQKLKAKSRAGKPRIPIKSADLSILKGRSMCSSCHHPLSVPDLVPAVSWVWLRGRCRYCGLKITDNPLVEIVLPLLFTISYYFWPFLLADIHEVVLFSSWLAFLVGLVALAVYDIKWMELPNRIIFPLLGLAVASRLFQAVVSGPNVLREAIYGAMILGGVFLLLFYVSSGKWIGGGDVKLGFVLGALVGGPLRVVFLLFIASLVGSIFSVPILIKTSKKHRKALKIPFGPFLILAAIVVQLSFANWLEALLVLG